MALNFTLYHFKGFLNKCLVFLVFPAVATCLVLPICNAQDLLDNMIAEWVKTRSTQYSECHAKLSLVVDGSDVIQRVEAWCQGDKLRNDYFDEDGDRVGFCVYIGEEYFEQVPPEKGIMLGLIELSKGYPFQRVIHPAQIGCCDLIGAYGKFAPVKWISKELPNESECFRRVSVDLGTSVRWNLARSQKLPTNFTKEEFAGYTSFAAFLKDHPEHKVVQCDNEIEVTFEKTAGIDLIRFQSVQQVEGIEGKSTAVMSNTFQAVPGISIPIIKTSEWTARFAGQIVESFRVNVDSIDFAPVSDQVFTFSGLNLKDDSTVRDLRDSSQYRYGVIKDGSFVPVSPTVTLPVAPPKGVASARVLRLVFIILILTGICVITARIVRRLMHQNESN